MSKYLTRPDNSHPATMDECASLWRQIDAMQIALSMAIRDLVEERRLALVSPGREAKVEKAEVFTADITEKLIAANTRYYEATETRLAELARLTNNGAIPLADLAHGHSH